MAILAERYEDNTDLTMLVGTTDNPGASDVNIDTPLGGFAFASRV